MGQVLEIFQAVRIFRPPPRTLVRRFFSRPRSSREPRLYGGLFGVSNRFFKKVSDRPEQPEKPVKPIVFLCPVGLSGINM